MLKIIEHRKNKAEEDFVDILIKWGINQNSFKKTGNLNETLKKLIPYISMDDLMGNYVSDIKNKYPDMFLSYKKQDFEISSKIIKIEKDYQLIEKWLKIATGKNCTLSLGYRGSKDGFGCSKSLVVIKSEDGFVFGGFADDKWTGNNAYKKSVNSFLFSLKNPTNQPQMMTTKSKDEHLFAQESSGPIFGSGFDMFITNNCQKSRGSNFVGFPYCYNGPIDFKGTPNSFFTGETSFQVNEIEVFEVKE